MFLFLGCNNSSTQEHFEYSLNEEELKNGFLICRLGTGYFSNYFKKYASKEKKYSHIGIVSKKDDTIYVYHSEASELTGVGCVKKEKLSSFLKGIKVYDFFEFKYPDSIKNKILEEVEGYYNKKTSFDLDFNSFNDREVYCSELIAISINNVLKTTVISPSLTLNGKKLFALDDIYLNENIKKITLVNNCKKNEKEKSFNYDYSAVYSCRSIFLSKNF